MNIKDTRMHRNQLFGNCQMQQKLQLYRGCSLLHSIKCTNVLNEQRAKDCSAESALAVVCWKYAPPFSSSAAINETLVPEHTHIHCTTESKCATDSNMHQNITRRHYHVIVMASITSKNVHRFSTMNSNVLKHADMHRYGHPKM